MPSSFTAVMKLGLSVGTCGRKNKPECSPVSSSVGSIVTPLACAHAMLLLTSASMTSFVTQMMLPLASFRQFHGSVLMPSPGVPVGGVPVNTFVQLRNSWLYVWFNHGN